VSTSASILQEETSIDEFFNVMATETLALFEHLEFDFLEEFDVFALARRGRTRDHHPPALFRAFLHCYYKNVYGIRPVTRELQNTVVWLSCGLRSTAVERRGRSLPHRPRTRRRRGLRPFRRAGRLPRPARLDLLHRFHRREDDARRPSASKGYDPTAEEYYHGYGCTIVRPGKRSLIAAEFTESKQALEETAMRVTCDALAVEKPIWMLWRQRLRRWLARPPAGRRVVPVAPYNARNTDDPKDIEYRVEARIDEHSEDVQLKQSTLDETYNRRSGVERTNDAVKDCGLGHVRARGRVHARAQVFLALCLSSRYCDHQRRTRRQSRKHRHHAMRTIL